MVTAKEKPIVDQKKINRRKSEHTTMDNYQFTKQARKREKRNNGTKKIARKQFKMALVISYISIIALNVSLLNSPN